MPRFAARPALRAGPEETTISPARPANDPIAAELEAALAGWGRYASYGEPCSECLLSSSRPRRESCAVKWSPGGSTTFQISASRTSWGQNRV